MYRPIIAVVGLLLLGGCSATEALGVARDFGSEQVDRRKELRSDDRHIQDTMILCYKMVLSQGGELSECDEKREVADKAREYIQSIYPSLSTTVDKVKRFVDKLESTSDNK